MNTAFPTTTSYEHISKNWPTVSNIFLSKSVTRVSALINCPNPDHHRAFM